jgi:hypothetical protein
VANVYQVAIEVGGGAHPQVDRLLGLTHTCCEGWVEMLHHVMGDGTVLPTLQHNYREDSSIRNVEVLQFPPHMDTEDG